MSSRVIYRYPEGTEHVLSSQEGVKPNVGDIVARGDNKWEVVWVETDASSATSNVTLRPLDGQPTITSARAATASADAEARPGRTCAADPSPAMGTARGFEP